jgi:hypothetical protein
LVFDALIRTYFVIISVHPAQKMSLHARQWCRRLFHVNDASHRTQHSVCSSGIHPSGRAGETSARSTEDTVRSRGGPASARVGLGAGATTAAAATDD